MRWPVGSLSSCRTLLELIHFHGSHLRHRSHWQVERDSELVLRLGVDRRVHLRGRSRDFTGPELDQAETLDLAWLSGGFGRIVDRGQSRDEEGTQMAMVT